MRPQHSVTRRKVTDSILSGIFWAAVGVISGLFDSDKQWSHVSLAWRSAANGLLFGLLAYFVLIPLSERVRTRRRIGLADILIVCGCLALMFVFFWMTLPP